MKCHTIGMTKTNVKMNTDITAMQYAVRYTQNGVPYSPPLSFLLLKYLGYWYQISYLLFYS